jgi:cardiolipin synthase
MATELRPDPQKTEIEFHSRTREAWESMYADCQRAQHSIEFEQYILRDDEIGRKFMTLFVEKAKAGVNIRLLLDRVGSRGMFNSQLVKDLTDHGGAVEFYNPIGWPNLFAPSTWFPRNHTKTMLIDSGIVHIGSACLAQYMADWRDLSARITGTLVEEIEKDFSYVWVSARERRVIARPEEVSDDPDFDYLVAKADLTPSPIYRQLLAQIHAARDYIYMATPYFLPPLGLRRALRHAARRGVDVRVVLTEQSDVPLAVHVSRSYFTALMRHGIKLYSYNKDTVFHAKYTLIDGKWATMGSVNLDYLSLLLNREANIVMRRADTVEDLKQEFMNDLGNCREIPQDFWKSIPFYYKIIGYLGRSIKRML